MKRMVMTTMMHHQNIPSRQIPLMITVFLQRASLLLNPQTIMGIFMMRWMIFMQR
ncbi:unnamed protein product [Porites lobata]|uniref:Uncharacterized protein n=1 Tax=Porites lobata TaxID=104759 RepID=A0ABN8S0S4_9CNID|nr:unnamed protein product [Porites lobata]CAH3184645.1 unnamed protein product [Porites lobata]